MAKDNPEKQPKPQGDKPQAKERPQGAGRGAKAEGAPKGSGKKKADVPAEALRFDAPPRLKVMYDQQVRSKLAEKFGVANRMSQPKLQKIVINVNMGRHLDGTKIPPHIKGQIFETLTKISGQKPIMLKAKKSVSNFKVREGYETAAMVTLRRDRMWHFMDRLIHLATPRIKDFRGVNDKAFDRQGNFAMGLNEQGVFPEINMAEAQFTHGMNISFTISNSDPAKSKFMLAELGMPFRKPEEKKKKAS